MDIDGKRTDELRHNINIYVLEVLRQSDPLWLFHAPIAVEGARSTDELETSTNT